MPYPAAAGAGAHHRVVKIPWEFVVPTSVLVPLFWKRPPPETIRTVAPVTGEFAPEYAPILISACPPAGMEAGFTRHRAWIGPP